jgi:hypothetical protein
MGRVYFRWSLEAIFGKAFPVAREFNKGAVPFRLLHQRLILEVAT